MTAFSVTRHGTTHTYVIADPLPIELEDYPFPRDVAKILAAGDAAWVKATEAHDAWTDAVDILENGAPEEDKDALIAAIRAGEPDPGTPATDAARRAEEIAWVAFEIARADARAPMADAQAAVGNYLRTHQAEVAAHELARLTEYRQAAQEAHQAVARAAEARERVGLSYVHLRWHSGSRFQPEPYRLAPGDYTTSDKAAYDLQVEDRYKVMAGLPTTPEPADVVRPAKRQTTFETADA